MKKQNLVLTVLFSAIVIFSSNANVERPANTLLGLTGVVTTNAGIASIFYATKLGISNNPLPQSFIAHLNPKRVHLWNIAARMGYGASASFSLKMISAGLIAVGLFTNKTLIRAQK